MVALTPGDTLTRREVSKRIDVSYFGLREQAVQADPGSPLPNLTKFAVVCTLSTISW